MLEQSTKYKDQRPFFMRKPVIAGNWKMYKSVGDSVATAVALKPLVANANHCEVVIAPVFTALKAVADRLEGSNIKVSAQDCATEIAEGAFTGEIAAFMIHDAGCSHVIVGHSERRQYYLETDHIVSKKAQAAREAGLTVIVCVGETLDQRDAGKALDVVKEQLTGSLSGLTASDLDRIIVAYEPVWAIGTGMTATPADASAVHKIIRAELATFVSKDVAAALPILYGGSVNKDNARALLAAENVDGLLVGGASLDPASWAAIAST